MNIVYAQVSYIIADVLRDVNIAFLYDRSSEEPKRPGTIGPGPGLMNPVFMYILLLHKLFSIVCYIFIIVYLIIKTRHHGKEGIN